MRVRPPNYLYCVPLRASRSLNEDGPSKSHEQALASVWCDHASARIQQNLKALTSSKELQLDSSMANIADQVMENGGTVPEHPLKV